MAPLYSRTTIRRDGSPTMNKYATEIGLQEKMDKFYRETGFEGTKINKHATMDVGRSTDILEGLR